MYDELNMIACLFHHTVSSTVRIIDLFLFIEGMAHRTVGGQRTSHSPASLRQVQILCAGAM